MSNVPYLPEEGQIISHFFDIPNRVKSVRLIDNQINKSAPKSDMTFNPVVLWNFRENPNCKIGENGLILLEADEFKADSVLIEITVRLIEYLPNPWIESIRFVLVTTPFPSQEITNVRELKGVIVLHLLELPYVANVRDGVLFAWPEGYNGKDFPNKVIYHLRPQPAPKPKQTPRPEKYPRPYIVPSPKPPKPDRRRKKKAPPDVLNYFEWLKPKSKWRNTYKAMYNQAWYGDISKNKFCSGKHPHKGRYYTFGNDRLKNVTGQGERTIERHLTLMLKHNIIRRWKGGYIGQGNSVYELPLDMRHVMSWKKHPRIRRK